MKHRWIVLIYDADSQEWSVLDDTDFEPQARESYQEIKDQGDTSPMILIHTGDFVTV